MTASPEYDCRQAMAATPIHAANRKAVKPRRAHPPSDGRSPETARRNVFMPVCGSEGWRAASRPSLESCSCRRARFSSARPSSSWFSVEAISTPHPVQCHPHQAASGFTLGRADIQQDDGYFCGSTLQTGGHRAADQQERLDADFGHRCHLQRALAESISSSLIVGTFETCRPAMMMFGYRVDRK